jgi:RHS repeat-associated protein
MLQQRLISWTVNNTTKYEVGYANTGNNCPGEFRNTAAPGLQNAYDANGNLTLDVGRNLSLAYNNHNLPTSISSPAGAIANVYRADGVKTNKYVYDASGRTVLGEKYLGSLVLNLGLPLRILHADGSIELNANLQPTYYYHLKDHLGNVRAVVSPTVTNSLEVVQTNDYYPFGMSMSKNSTTTPYNKYKYNGKEEQEMPGKWLDYGARFYDAQLGRWHSVDPHAENYYAWSPYHYAANNPIIMLDPDGRDWYQSTGKEGAVMWQKGSADVEGFKNIGANYTQNIGEGISITFTQNEATSMTESVLSPNDFKTQMSGKFDENGKPIKKEGELGNCYYQAGEMVKKSGAESLPGDANKADDGIKYMDKQIDKGNSARVYVDRNNDGKGDHWVAISSRTTDLKTNQKSYGFFDPAATYSNKGGVNNTFNVVDGKLTGTANAYQSRKVTYEVVQVRKNKN